MTFLGNVDCVEDRAASKTTTLVLQKCLGGKGDGRRAINKFLEAMRIKPDAFFHDIDGDWLRQPFIGQHVFKVVQAAGYEGTEHDLWNTVTGDQAPYPVKMSKMAGPKKPKAPSKECPAIKVEGRAAKVALLAGGRANLHGCTKTLANDSWRQKVANI